MAEPDIWTSFAVEALAPSTNKPSHRRLKPRKAQKERKKRKKKKKEKKERKKIIQDIIDSNPTDDHEVTKKYVKDREWKRKIERARERQREK